MSYYVCREPGCGFNTLFEGGAASHSKTTGHFVVEEPVPASIVQASTKGARP